MIETGVVINRWGVPIYWHQPEGRSSAFLPDSHDLWNVLWRERNNELSGFAHTHPGEMTHPSLEDLTTFAAIERGLGKHLDWWIVTRENVTLYRHVDTAFSDIKGEASEYISSPHLRLTNITRDCYLACNIGNENSWRCQEWLPELRKLSYL